MNNFKMIYKILKTLEKALDIEEFDKTLISAEALGLSEPRWARIMEMLVANDYVKGVNIRNTFDSRVPKVDLVNPAITLQGLEYLAENSMMKKAADVAKGVIDAAL